MRDLLGPFSKRLCIHLRLLPTDGLDGRVLQSPTVLLDSIIPKYVQKVIIDGRWMIIGQGEFYPNSFT